MSDSLVIHIDNMTIHVDNMKVYSSGINETIGTCDIGENLPIKEDSMPIKEEEKPQPAKAPASYAGYCPTNLKQGERVVVWCGGKLAANQSELGTFITYTGPGMISIVAHADDKEFPDTYYSWRRVDD